MSDNELMNFFNEIDYTDEEVENYMSIAEKNKGEFNNVLDNVRTKLERNGLINTNHVIKLILKEGELLDGVVKVKDIKGLLGITVSSMTGGTIGKSNDYGVVNIFYFTNKRIIIVNSNYINDIQAYKSIYLDEIVAIAMTNKKPYLMEDKDNGVKVIFKERSKKVVKNSLEHILGISEKNKIKIVEKNGMITSLIIAKSDAEKLNRYIEKWIDIIKFRE